MGIPEGWSFGESGSLACGVQVNVSNNSGQVVSRPGHRIKLQEWQRELLFYLEKLRALLFRKKPKQIKSKEGIQVR